MKIFNLTSEFEFPSLYTIFSVCCSSRRKHERLERLLQQERHKNAYLQETLLHNKELLIQSYETLLEYERSRLNEMVFIYKSSVRTCESVKKLYVEKNIEELQKYVFVDGTVENVVYDWEKTVELEYETLEKQMKVFESIEARIKAVQKY